jgi:anti-sigma factor RsiW
VQTNIPDITCRQFVEQVTDYLESALPAGTRQQCDAHTANCAPCATYLEQMRQTILVLGKLIDDTVEPAARAELLRRFRAWQADQSA